MHNRSLLDHSVDLDAGIGTYQSTRGAAYALVGCGSESEMISSVVYLFRLEEKYVGRTCDHTQIATLATFLINLYSA